MICLARCPPQIRCAHGWRLPTAEMISPSTNQDALDHIPLCTVIYMVHNCKYRPHTFSQKAVYGTTCSSNASNSSRATSFVCAYGQSAVHAVFSGPTMPARIAFGIALRAAKGALIACARQPESGPVAACPSLAPPIPASIPDAAKIHRQLNRIFRYFCIQLSIELVGPQCRSGSVRCEMS